MNAHDRMQDFSAVMAAMGVEAATASAEFLVQLAEDLGPVLTEDTWTLVVTTNPLLGVTLAIHGPGVADVSLETRRNLTRQLLEGAFAANESPDEEFDLEGTVRP